MSTASNIRKLPITVGVVYYESTPFPVFPKMEKKFRSKTWMYTDARNYLTKLLAIVRFGRSNSNGLLYGKGPKPAGWPSDSVPWKAFEKRLEFWKEISQLSLFCNTLMWTHMNIM